MFKVVVVPRVGRSVFRLASRTLRARMTLPASDHQVNSGSVLQTLDDPATLDPANRAAERPRPAGLDEPTSPEGAAQVARGAPVLIPVR